MVMPWKAIRQVKAVIVQCANKSLVLFYAGADLPSSSSHGCYLIFDAIDRSLIVVHSFPFPMPGVIRVGGAAILHHSSEGDGAYVLAELVTPFKGDLPDAALVMWLSHSPTTPSDPPGQWIKEDVCLPTKVCTGTEPFASDLAFLLGESHLC
ncbi:hypothetical protein E2562_032578 [Oryza meyeriana var. granulata]|uniref:DUF1618 domain-containing protein n=1 Tax=Oryza meyeriana var. granulata TaxID=110450 RepID=A0A6G1ED11_9ORYZ|nr:hypothetical protein E2562_032578 [Oryza meyeriana var. granulata]